MQCKVYICSYANIIISYFHTSMLLYCILKLYHDVILKQIDVVLNSPPFYYLSCSDIKIACHVLHYDIIYPHIMTF